MKMRKTLVTLLFSALVAASSVQIAAAAQQPVGHHRVHKAAVSRTALTNEQFRNSNNSQVRDNTVSGMCGLFPGPCQ
jgi:hypothetical protein